MRFAPALLMTAVLLASVHEARAGHLFCHQCGCHTHCKKICRLECGKKKETKTEYSCESEDFCVPGPSHKRGYKYECDEHGHKHRKIIWQPTCAKVHTRKKLIKKEVTKEVPDYKWVVEEYCCICGVLVKVERQAASEKDAKAAGGDKGAAPKTDSKAETPVEQLPLASVEGVLPLSAHAPVDQYAAFDGDVAQAVLNDDAQNFFSPPPLAPVPAAADAPPQPSGPRHLLVRLLGK